jgi:hypothetical protein
MNNFDLRKFLAEGKLYEAMSPQDVVDIADTVAEEFTIESADTGEFLVYSVGKMEADDMSFELDTDVTSQTPKGIDTRGVGEGWGGIFRIKPTADGYEVRNAEKGGLVAMIDTMGNFKMLSADESRAEMGLEETEEDDFLELVGQGVDSFPRPSLGEEEIEEEKSNKMKKSELKEMIKAAMLAEMEVEETEVYEAEEDEDVEVAVSDEEEIEDVDVDVDVEDAGEMDVEDDAKVELTGDKAAVSDNLEAALEAARALGDEKLVDQIGNTITFFTRAHIVKEADMLQDEAEMELEEALNKPVTKLGPDVEKRLQSMGFETKVFPNPAWGNIPNEAIDAIEANPKLAGIAFVKNQSGSEAMRVMVNAERKKDLQKLRDYFQVPEEKFGPTKELSWVAKQIQNVNPGDWIATKAEVLGGSGNPVAVIDWFRLITKGASQTRDASGNVVKMDFGQAAESLNEEISRMQRLAGIKK